MNSFNSLVEIFSDFPGIGPRQAKRFVYFLLTMPASYTDKLVKSLENLRINSVTCASCYRIFSKNSDNNHICAICLNKNRDSSQLAVVCRDSDLENIEKSGAYKGYYFILGGVVPILESEPERKIRSKELLSVVKNKLEGGLKEVILAMSANSDSENTARYVEKLLSSYKENGLRISLLGRGLSTGTELEYSDSDTLKNALSNRK